ncbi:MAG: GntR family transcriptional regulator [Ilumatobacteraceae bacterium]
MTRPRSRYLELADQLEERWRGLAPGAAVAGEYGLAAEFGVNRLTAREAVRELERRAIVRRYPGRGTFIAHRLRYRLDRQTTPSFRALITSLGHEPGVSSSEVHWMGRGASRRLVVERVLTVDGLIASSHVDQFPFAVGKVVEGLLHGEGSISGALVESGWCPRREHVEVAIRCPDRSVADQLGYVAAPTPAWHLRSRTVDRRSGDVIHASQSWMRPDMFELEVVLES